jgi:hypothetical protein
MSTCLPDIGSVALRCLTLTTVSKEKGLDGRRLGTAGLGLHHGLFLFGQKAS